MRMAIMAGLLSVGMLVGCGGAEMDAQEPTGAPTEETVTAMAPPPCERACLTLYNYCMRSAQTPEQIAFCEEDLDSCYMGCEY
ncbi:hypothetical protein HPC49_08840 [Pyxidicoccus fallax]|uniref:Lipoprotein n=1 Tax=Pyxidicoccus fallax TaxID=394095 RepID=A0A848L6Q4_9BACT|nr:hypothetical protein [Pyxidicoccus fallax]NMO13952.1 hypothetical protein [Pyxidicoccus fallax]NPC78351.1 hypothetical protein [Pyxidicoccus fallax]